MIGVIKASDGEVGEHGRAGDCINGAGLDPDIPELVIVELAQGAACCMDGANTLPGFADRRKEPFGCRGTACGRCNKAGLTFGFQNRPDRGMIVYHVSSSQVWATY